MVLQPRNGRNRRGLGSSPFARHYLGNHCYFLFLPVLRCFSSRRLPPLHKAVGSRIFHARGCPIRKCSDQRVCAPPQTLSQLIASFVASETLGIPRVLFLTSYLRLISLEVRVRCLFILMNKPAFYFSFLVTLTSKNVCHTICGN